jgi:hypothetical protein
MLKDEEKILGRKRKFCSDSVIELNMDKSEPICLKLNYHQLGSDNMTLVWRALLGGGTALPLCDIGSRGMRMPTIGIEDANGWHSSRCES